MKLKKWTLTLCLMGTLLLPLQILTQTTLASEGQTEEELAPGFNDCISRSTSVLEMRQCHRILARQAGQGPEPRRSHV